MRERAIAGRTPQLDLGRPLLLTGPSRAALLAALDRLESSEPGAERLALAEVNPRSLERARRTLGRGLSSHGRDGVFYAGTRLLEGGGKLAFLFPGLDARFAPCPPDLVAFVGATGGGAAERDASTMEDRTLAVLRTNTIARSALERLAIRPDMLAGHSIGEWSAMVSAGVSDQPAIDRLTESIRRGSQLFPDLDTLAATCSIQLATEVAGAAGSIEITHDNCPHQVLLSGTRHDLQTVAAEFAARGVLVQWLPLGSGVHSRRFAATLGHYSDQLQGIAYRRAALPLYSATTVAPYPDDSEAIRTLAARHMTERVRFRELLLRMHRDGARVFVQVGCGSLTGFVEDTLRDLPHACISAVNPERGFGLPQLLRAACLIWCHGGHVEFPGVDATVGSGSAAAGPAGPLEEPREPSRATQRFADAIRGYERNMQALERLQSRVMQAALAADRRTLRALPPARLELSLASLPELADHAFCRQAPDWRDAEDTQPVVPMSGLIELMLRCARGQGTRAVRGLDGVSARRWLIVAPRVDLTPELSDLDHDRLHVRLGDHADGVVLLGEAPPAEVGVALPPLRDPIEPPHSADRIYSEGWLFHGPRYRVITEVLALGSDGIDAWLTDTGALGALLDGVAQLLGYWLAATAASARISMPVRIDRLRFHGRGPAVRDPVMCRIRVVACDGARIEARAQLEYDGRCWATIEGLEARRFATTDRFFALVRQPDRKTLADGPRPGMALLTDPHAAANMREYLLHRYLTRAERTALDAVSPGERRARVNAYVAVRDAVRSRVWQHDPRPLFPTEVAVAPDLSSAVARGERWFVATAVRGETIAAYASQAPSTLEVIPLGEAGAELLEAPSKAAARHPSAAVHDGYVVRWSER